MSETAQTFAWTIATMRADSALVSAASGGVWQGFADIGTVGPYGLVVQQSAVDSLTLTAFRTFTRLLLQIKAIGPASGYAALVTIADRIDTLFKRVGNVSLSPGYMLSCYREQSFSYDELVNGQQWSHLGGLYHITLQGA